MGIKKYKYNNHSIFVYFDLDSIQAFKRARNKCNGKIREAKRKHYRNLIEENKGNPRKFWDTIKTIFILRTKNLLYLVWRSQNVKNLRTLSLNIFLKLWQNWRKTLSRYPIYMETVYHQESENKQILHIFVRIEPYLLKNSYQFWKEESRQVLTKYLLAW